MRAGLQLPVPSLTTKELKGRLAISNPVNSPDNWVKPDDRVRIDNSWILALSYYQRHSVPPAEFYGWNQFRDDKGNPLYTQRSVNVGMSGTEGAVGCIHNGQISGKVLMIQNLMDIDAHAWAADWYRFKVKQAKMEDQFALQFLDHAQHDNPLTSRANAYHIPYDGAVMQGLRDLATWVEKGEKPKQTSYKVVDSIIELPGTASERGGIQPLVDLKVNGKVRYEVKVGEVVKFSASCETPTGTGKTVDARLDYEGMGTFPVAAKLDTPQEKVQIESSHTYNKPGTYFPVLRVASHRQGDMHTPVTPYARVYNIARARVVVTQSYFNGSVKTRDIMY